MAVEYGGDSGIIIDRKLLPRHGAGRRHGYHTGRRRGAGNESNLTYVGGYRVRGVGTG